jgi:hypothetical protein
MSIYMGHLGTCDSLVFGSKPHRALLCANVGGSRLAAAEG